jgi:hypothetical protein
MIAIVGASDVVELKRRGRARNPALGRSAQKSFAYVSWQMFQDNPIVGVGFGRFYDKKLPYLSGSLARVRA